MESRPPRKPRAAGGHAAALDLRWSVAAAVVPAALMAGTNILLARSLGIVGFGQWVFFNQVAGYTATILTGIATFTLSYHIPRGDYDGRDLLAATGIAAMIVGAVGAVMALGLAKVALDNTDAGALLLGMALVVATSVQYWAFASLDSGLFFSRRGGLSVLAASTGLAVLIVLAWVGTLSSSSAMGIRAIALGCTGIVAWQMARALLPRSDNRLGVREGLRVVFADSWPVTTGSVIGAGMMALVLTGIGSLGGQATVGAAGIGIMLAQPIALLSIALTAVLLPHGARQDGSRADLRSLGLAVSGLAFLYAAGISVCGGWLFEIVAGASPSDEGLSVALALLWGYWFRQVQGVDTVILRSAGRIRDGLAIAIAGALPVLPLAWIASRLLTESGAVAIASSWAASQGAATVFAALLHRRHSKLLSSQAPGGR